MSGNSTYPETEDNYVELTDGVDIMEADQINDSYAAHASMQSFVGASGKSAAYNTDLIAQLVKVLPTIKLSYVDAETIQASAGVVWCLKADETIRVARENDITTDIDGNDLDAAGPTLANSTVYYVYADADSLASSVEFVISTSPSAPTGPVLFQLIGGFSTNASGEIIETTVWSVAGYRIVNVQADVQYEKITATTTMPADDSIPQIGEGTLVGEITHAPQNADNKIILLGMVCMGGLANAMCAAFFKVGTDDAFSSSAARPNSTDGVAIPIFAYQEAGSLDARTYQLRAGGGTAGTYAINGGIAGDPNTQLHGGVCFSGFILIELGRI